MLGNVDVELRPLRNRLVADVALTQPLICMEHRASFQDTLGDKALSTLHAGMLPLAVHGDQVVSKIGLKAELCHDVR